MTGSDLEARFGCPVAGAGETNGDGYDDVIVGATRHGEYGAVAAAVRIALG